MFSSFTCFAHRGASGHEPENSLRSFLKALELGAQWIECDVRVVEKTALIFHDRTLQRMTGSAGMFAQKSLAELRSLSLPKGEKIPMLSEALQLLRGKASLQVELKGPQSGAIVANELLRALDQGWDTKSLLVSSFDYEELLAFKKAAPQIPLGLLVYGYPLNCLGIAKRISAISVHLHHDSVTEKRVRTLQKAGYRVFVYTVNDADDVRWLQAIGVDGVFSNFPELALFPEPVLPSQRRTP
jgi:glycerophosphoryl diester phosphodiesterase